MKLNHLLSRLELEEEEEGEEIPLEELMGIPSWAPGQMTFFGPLSRHISVSGGISEALAVGVCSQIQELTIRDQDAPITLHINTPGGSIVDGLAIYDMCKIVSNPIIAIVNGGALSAGLLILAAADVRLATPHSMFFYHQPIMSELTFVNAEEAGATSELYTRYQGICNEIIRTRAKMAKRKFEKNFANKSSFWFGVDEALEFNIIDDLLEYTKKPKIKIEDLL
jgi:ATP-dependent Clp protease, protease subunit